jgi:hypothetical protein
MAEAHTRGVRGETGRGPDGASQLAQAAAARRARRIQVVLYPQSQHQTTRTFGAAVMMEASMSPSRVVSVSIGLLIVGILLAAIGTSITLDAAGLTIGGIGAVGLVAAAFLAIGLADERQRATDDEARRRRSEPS